MNELKLLKEYLKISGRSLTPDQEKQFYDYYSLLVERNRDINLTAITDFDSVQEKHFLDSVALGEVRDLSGELKVVDIGTGAGFPGIPLKIMYPNLNVTLIDSLRKRVDFLNEVIEKLGLTGITAVHARAEDAGRDEDLRENFDLCVSRAVADLRVLSEYCLPLVNVGGSFVSYKAGGSEEEINEASNAISLLGGEIEKTDTLVIGPSKLERVFVSIKKVESTDEKYPRKAGKVTKKPL